MVYAETDGMGAPLPVIWIQGGRSLRDQRLAPEAQAIMVLGLSLRGARTLGITWP